YTNQNNTQYSKTDIITSHISSNLCKLNEIPSEFRLIITTISPAPCTNVSQFRCLSDYCINSDLYCDGIQSCNDGSDEKNDCQQKLSLTIQNNKSIKLTRKFSGTLITISIVFGLLLIIASVVIGFTFVYVQRKRKRRHFTYSLDNTEDWDYHLFDDRREAHETSSSDLRQQNITSEQLNQWSTTIHTIEKYQIYLDHSFEESTKQFFYNCSDGWFGTHCEYIFNDTSITNMKKFIEKRFTKYRRQTESKDVSQVTNGTCYTHLKCIQHFPSR
ncbi:unnamed protein product, partial [Didymodactylos carnosus]